MMGAFAEVMQVVAHLDTPKVGAPFKKRR